MRCVKMYRTAIVLYASVLVCGMALGAEVARSLDSLISSQELPDGWMRTGETETYTKDTIFNLIDGEAELYFPYGFKRTISASYLRNGETENAVSVEVYEMGSPLDAFGVYSTYRDAEAKPFDVGAEGFRGSTMAVFYQGGCFVKLRVAKPDDSGDRLLSCARALAKFLPPNKTRPKAIEMIEVEGVDPKTVQYIGQSVLGYAFFPRGLTASAKVPNADNPVRAFIVFAGSIEGAWKAVADYKADLEKNGGTFEWKETPSGKVLLAQDPLHKGVAILQAGAYVVGAARVPEPTLATDLLKRLQTRATALNQAEGKAHK